MTYQIAKSLIVFLAFGTAASLFLARAYRLLWLNLRAGQPTSRYMDWAARWRGLALYVGGQLRLFRFLASGIAHFFIFWGFLLLSLTILQAILEGLLAFRGELFILPWLGEFGPLALLQDVFAVLVCGAVGYALWVRLGVNPERYRGSHTRQGVLVLVYILVIMLSLLVMNGLRGNLGEDPAAGWRVAARGVGWLFASLPETTQAGIAEVSYWIHLGVVLVFLTELPTGKHFHVVTSLPAVLLRNLEPAGRLPPALQVGERVGASTITDFRWRTLLDFYTCTECGRCQDVCPAYASGLALSPKRMIMGLREQLQGRGRQAGAEDELVGKAISAEAVWACSTCLACDQECPLFIEHVAPLVELRRALLVAGRVDAELQDALNNLGRYGNAFGQAPRARPQWTRTLEAPLRDARREPVEYLWFVGDTASYNPAVIPITQKTARVFQQAGLDFGILYESEQNAANDVRRAGEEGLFEMLKEKNLRALEKAHYSRIVTTDPHTYNTLKHEYFNGSSPGQVLHASELLDALIHAGELRLRRPLERVVTYHDPCYLGRYNQVYDAPRRVLTAAGCTLLEMPRHKDRALCCGAGGGRIWMNEGPVRERPSEQRVREALTLPGVSTLVAACPKDLSMFQDAVKTTRSEDRLAVRDLVELVYESLEA
jgi:Fe-S oxidoreductase